MHCVDENGNLVSFEGITKKEYRDRVLRLFRMWNRRLLRTSAAHYMASKRFASFDTTLTIINIVSAILALFLSSNTQLLEMLSGLNGDDGSKGPIYVSILSLMVVASSAAQYILQYSSRSDTHKQAGNEFSNLRRKMERYWSRGNLHPEAIHSLNRSYNMISKYPPLVPRRIWEWSLKAKNGEISAINETYFRYNGMDIADFSDIDS